MNRTVFKNVMGAMLTFVALVATGTAFSSSAEGAWPQYRGPNRNGITEERGWSWQWGTNGPKVLWRASVGTGFSSFAVSDNRVYTMGNTRNIDTVFCFAADSGKILWQHSYPCEAQPLSYEGGPSSTPAVDMGRVFTFSKSGDLFCLDGETGKMIWNKKIPLWPYQAGDWQNNWRYAGSPLIMGEHLFMSVGRAGSALNKRNGAIIWESPAGHPGYSSPVPFPSPRGQALAFFSGHAVYGVEAASGKELWQFPWKTLWDLNAADPVISNEQLFVSSGNGVGCALFDISGAIPRELWRNKTIKNRMNSSVLWQGLLFGFSDTDLACIAWDTGDEKWRTRDLRNGSLILVGGKLVLLSETGQLVVAEPTGNAYKPLGQARVLTGRCWTTPVLAGGHFYVRNAAGEVVCLDLRTPAKAE